MTTSSLTVRLAAFVASGLFLFLACATESKDSNVSSSQTHWLKACESSAECGDLTCSCGVCTRACDDDDACEDGSSCFDTDDVAACASSAPESVCLAGCDRDADCGSMAECTDGACTSSGTTPDDDDDAPLGVACGDYPSCEVETPCESGECIAFAECGGAICIDGGEACELSCPDISQCLLLESYPAQLACEGKVPAIPADPSDDDVTDDDVTDDDVTDDDVTDDDVTDDDVTDDDVTDDDVTDDDVTDDDVTDDDVQDPPGVECADYAPCSADDANPCANCVAVPGCDTPICIDQDEFCELSCPLDDCRIGESFPGSPSCTDLVPGNPAPDGDDPIGTGDAGAMGPPGVDCSEHPICDPDGPGCDPGDNCMALVGCDFPVCIPAEEACEQSCPDPETCAIAESYPEQLFCDGRVDAHGEQDPDTSASTFSCGEQTCSTTTEYCTQVLSGLPGGMAASSCSANPEGCDTGATCECLGFDSGGGSCMEGPDGGVTVIYAAP